MEDTTRSVAVIMLEEVAKAPDPREPHAWVPPRGLTTGAAVLASALLVTLLLVTRRDAPQPPETRRGTTAGPVLAAAADAAGRAPALAPGQIRHVTVHETIVDVVTDPTGNQNLEPDHTVSEQWIPADLHADWHWRFYQDSAGSRLLVSDLHGPCGSFYPEAHTDPCEESGTWQLPGPSFVASLPQDPAAMLARLRADAAVQENDRDQGAWEYAAAALESSILPPPTAAVVYRGLAGLPGLVVVRGPSRAASMIVERIAEDTRFRITIDTRTGALLGHQRWQTTAVDGIPAGTLINETRVSTEVLTRQLPAPS
ncbi:hypothetical protein [Actinoplanes sp. RD1]|uniref:hypothetical protein n=1 Tax=Actinoplanes sp. RD1 TaxID=3064538 RepID=UPI00274254C9|nr:hypothetical protein [Actinoplanes sp. RD1]